MAYPNQYGDGQAGYPTYLPQQNFNAQQYAPQMGGIQQIPQMQQPTQGAPIWVQGEAGAKSFLVAPGQSLILMDSEAEVFYIKSTDASGVPMPLRIFDYKERVHGAQRPSQAAQTPAADYVTRSEYDVLAAKLADVTAKLESIYIVPAPGAMSTEPPQRMRRGLREEGMNDV